MAQIMRLESVDDFFDDKPPTVQPKNASSVLPEKILKVPDVKPSEAGPHHDNDDDGNDISTIPLNVSEEKLGEENKKVASKESEVDTQQSLTAGDYEDANVEASEHQKENQEPPASEASGEDEWESDDEGSKEESVSEEQEASEEEASGEEEEEQEEEEEEEKENEPTAAEQTSVEDEKPKQYQVATNGSSDDKSNEMMMKEQDHEASPIQISPDHFEPSPLQSVHGIIVDDVHGGNVGGETEIEPIHGSKPTTNSQKYANTKRSVSITKKFDNNRPVPNKFQNKPMGAVKAMVIMDSNATETRIRRIKPETPAINRLSVAKNRPPSFKIASRRSQSGSATGRFTRPLSRLNTAQRRGLKDQVNFLRNQVRQLEIENRTFKSIHIRQQRALADLKDRKMNMPEIESRYVEEIRVLRNEIRQYREKVREQERLLRERNDQLQRSLLKATRFEKVLNEKGYSFAQRRLEKAQRDEIERKLEEAESKVKELEIELEKTRNHYTHQFQIELQRHKQTQMKLKEVETALSHSEKITNNINNEIPSYIIDRNANNLRVISSRRPKNMTMNVNSNKLMNNKSNEQTKPLRSVPEQQTQPQPLPKPVASPQKITNRFGNRIKKEEMEPEVIPIPNTRKESTPTKASSDSGVDSLKSDPLQNSLERRVEGKVAGNAVNSEKRPVAPRRNRTFSLVSDLKMQENAKKNETKSDDADEKGGTPNYLNKIEQKSRKRSTSELDKLISNRNRYTFVEPNLSPKSGSTKSMNNELDEILFEHKSKMEEIGRNAPKKRSLTEAAKDNPNALTINHRTITDDPFAEFKSKVNRNDGFLDQLFAKKQSKSQLNFEASSDMRNGLDEEAKKTSGPRANKAAMPWSSETNETRTMPNGNLIMMPGMVND